MPCAWSQARLVFIIIVFFILLSNLPLIQGYTSNMSYHDASVEHLYEEYNLYLRDTYDPSDSSSYEPRGRRESFPADSSVDVTMIQEVSFSGRSGLMDSAWPMYSHDVRHTGRSPYSTVNTTGVEKWRIATDGLAQGGPTIDKDGVIYIGSYQLNAVYLNGTVKWIFHEGYAIDCAPAIAEDGTIYFGTVYGRGLLYALYPNGTLKWTYKAGDLFSSPAIGDDGTIYVGGGQSIHAVYPNGTMKWKFTTGHVVYSSPAIGTDGTIYCGSHDTYLYALYPENGTMKWRYKTGDWVRVGPCIADDGTIYVVSLDTYLHAVYPNGAMRWKTYCGAGTSPTIGWDGMVYAGGHNLYAINPEDGTVKWIYDAPGTIEGGTPCHSLDGTIYLGTWQGGYIVAVNPDGTEQWRRQIGWTDSPPAIGADGTVYIGSGEHRLLHAFGKGALWVDANGPYKGNANKPIQFTGNIFGGVLPYDCLWDFGDGTTSIEQNPQHVYIHRGNYTATFTVTDAEGNSSNDTASVFVDYSLPTVSIIKPTHALYIANVKILPFIIPFIIGRITIEVDASQPEGLEIAQVAFIIDKEVKATVTSKPYTWTWKELSLLPHEIIIRAVDSKGNTNWATLRVWKFF